MKYIDFCIVCGTEFERINSRQITCLNPECQKEWKSGTHKKTKIKKTYNCLRCGQLTTNGNICKRCSRINSKIQTWDT